jgi:hypothetical protein
MNDHCAGAIEALAWVENLLEEAAIKKLDIGSIMDEVEHVRQELMRGVAVDFEKRILRS